MESTKNKHNAHTASSIYLLLAVQLSMFYLKFIESF